MLTPAIPLLWAVAVDPCAPAESASPADRHQAALYLGIGDDELRSGARDTATVAYQEALRREPGNPHARAALARLCQEARAAGRPDDDRFTQALALMNAGQRRPAAEAFEAVRVADHEPAAALLEGVCLYELHDDARAEVLLREAAGDPALADTAGVFLGLLALRADDSARATEFLRAAAASDNPSLRQTAAEILRSTRGAGRGVVSLLAEAGFDSNVALTPDGSVAVPSSRDGAAGVAGTGVWRPLGRSGPYLRAAGQYRKQFQLTAYDLGAVGGAVGWRQAKTGATAGATFAAGEYSYDFFTLGDARYLSAHRLGAEAQLDWSPVLVAATAFARFESYLQDLTADYSGTKIAGDAQVALHIGPDALAGCGYHLAHDGTRALSLTYWEHGPACHAWLGTGARWRLVADAGLTFRRYAAPDTLGMVDRHDQYIDGMAAAEWDAGLRWTLRLTVTARKATSTVAADYAYTKVTATLAAICALPFL